MPSMLSRGKEQLRKEPADVRARVRWRRGDLTRVRVGRRFQTVISPFNVWMHLYTRPEVEAALATVRAHLRPGGRFIFDVLLPDHRALARDPSKFYSCGIRKIPGEKGQFRYQEAFDYDPLSQVQMVTMAFEDVGNDRDFITPLAHRQFFPAELEALLHYNGFSIEDRFGGFDRSPMQAGAESQILIARSASTSRRRSLPR